MNGLQKALGDAFPGSDVLYSRTEEGYPIFVDGLFLGVVSHEMANDPDIESMGHVLRESLLSQKYSSIVGSEKVWGQ